MRRRAPGGVPALRSRWAAVDGLCVHSRVAEVAPARAPTVVLVHGLVSGRYFVRTARQLAPWCRVHVPDLPGYGPTPVQGVGASVPELADVLAGYVRACGLDDAVLVGHSVGTQIVVDLAVRHPDLVGRAVLVAPTFEPGARTIRQQYGRWLRNVVQEPVSLNAVLAKEVLELGVVRPVRVTRGALRDRMEDKLPRVRVPVLVVRGARDPHAPQGWCERVASLVAAGELAVIEGAPHTVIYTAPAQLGWLVREFAGAEGPASA